METPNPPLPDHPGEKPVVKRRMALALALAVVLIGGAMFTLGIFVGRQSLPIHFDIDQINRHLAYLREGMRRENEAAQVYRQKIEGARDLDFPEALKKSGNLPLEDNGFEAEAPGPAEAAPSATTAPGAGQVKPGDKPAMAPPARGRIVIQVASVQDINAAEKMVARLQAQGIEAYWVAGELAGKGTWYRVRIGGFADRDQAAEVLDRLAQNNLRGIILETKQGGNSHENHH